MDGDDNVGGCVVPRRPVGRRRPLNFRFEIRVLDGPEGEALARQQAAVIRDVLVWIAEQRRAADAGPDTGHTTAAEPPPEHDA
ncbi:hypothetical protein [Streptomyces sp. KR55]|uniref:hypothetical protein n=1 Tax=Streptomyces sp. KR55 TaxID=3457425 RepID=UPI003FD54155